MFRRPIRHRQYKPFPMRYHELGDTGMYVSYICLGGASFSNVRGFREEQRCVNLIKDCINKGINFVETGPWYGQGTSEGIYGKAFQDIPRNNFYVASMVGRYERDPIRMFDFSADKTEIAVDNTLYLLGLDYVDVIYVHDLSFAPNQDIILNETLPALQKAVDAGKVKHIGLADYNVPLMKQIVQESEVDISVVMSYAKSTILDNRFQNDVLFFKRRGIGVVNADYTSMGLLTNFGVNNFHPASWSLKKLCERASCLCSNYGVDLSRIALAYSMSQPHINSHVCNMYNKNQMYDAIDILLRGLTPTEDLLYNELRTKYFCCGPKHWDDLEFSILRQRLLQD